VEPAVSGQHGHTKTLEAALKVADVCGLDEAATLEALREYGARCVPPWSEKELRHKAREAVKILEKRGGR
jgi:imidazolonepropionase-like amidohydrolase